MNTICFPNPFYSCSNWELIVLYEESKKYNHLADIPETSPLHKYKTEFTQRPQNRTYGHFCLCLCRAYIDKGCAVTLYESNSDLREIAEEVLDEEGND